jgi:hypothetical protein
MRLLLLLFAGIMFSFVQAEAAIYEWVDDQGVTHFTDDPDSVPAKFLKRVKKRNPISDDSTRQSESQAVSKPAPATTMVTEYGGHNEAWWRSNFATLRASIKELQESLPGKKEELSALRHKKRVYQRATDRVKYTKQQKAIEKDQARIAELEQKLATLEDDASRAGVPFEWRR